VIVLFKKMGGRPILRWFAQLFCHLEVVLSLFCFAEVGIFSVLFLRFWLNIWRTDSSLGRLSNL